VRRRVAVESAHTHAAACQVERGRTAHGTEAGNQDVVVVCQWIRTQCRLDVDRTLPRRDSANVPPTTRRGRLHAPCFLRLRFSVRPACWLSRQAPA
jgi:hypothetical protein